MDIGIDFDRHFQVFPGAAESPLSVFRCGTKVQGRVVLTQPPPHSVPIHHVELALFGDQILNSGGKSDGPTQRHITTILDHHDSLLQTGPRGVLISPGRHVFPFVFNLPKDLPSTFTGAHVQIQYQAKATVELDSELPLEVAEPFVVFSRPSPKTSAAFRIAAEREGVVCKWRLDRRNFQQNEMIFIDANVVNKKMGPRVTALSAVLTMEAAFRSPAGEWLSDHQVLSTFRDPSRLEKGAGRRWTGVSLHIPQLAPSSCNGAEDCRCKISYRVQLRVERETASAGVQLTVPVVVGVEIPPHKLVNRRPTKQHQFDCATEQVLSNRASENSSFRGSLTASFQSQVSSFAVSEIKDNVTVKTNPVFVDDDRQNYMRQSKASTSNGHHYYY